MHSLVPLEEPAIGGVGILRNSLLTKRAVVGGTGQAGKLQGGQ